MGAVEITAVSCAAHWAASGSLPPAGWVLASVLPLFGIGVFLHRGRLTLSTAFVAAAAGQVFMHLALAQGTPTDHMRAAGSDWPMVIAHAVGAIATVLLWSLRRHAWDVLVRVVSIRLMALRRSAYALVVRADASDAWLRWMGSRRRGPPRWVVS